MTGRISQVRARTLRKRVNELEQQMQRQHQSWGKEWPDGEHLFTLSKGDLIAQEELDMVRVSRKLGHPVIVTHDNTSLHFYGVK